MKQNKNSSVIRFLAFVSALVVLVFSISVPSFAYTDSSINGIDFSDQPLPVYTSSYSSEQAFNASYKITPVINNFVQYGLLASPSDCYSFCYSSGNYNYVVVCSLNNNVKRYQAVCENGNYWYVQGGDDNVQSSIIDNTNFYYVEYRPSAYNYINTLPIFNSLNDGLSAVRDWINNPPAPVPDPQGPLNISIPCGNALFIDISDLTGLTGSLSTLTTQSHSSPFSWNPTLSYTDSVPSSGSPVGNPINWVGTGGTDVFGRYRSWKCNLIVQPNKKYIAITNPFFNSEYLDPEHEDNNFPITVSLSNYRDYFFVPLNAQYVNGEGVQNSYTDEQTQAPTPGGNNTTTTGNSINDFLQNIASSISGFFQGAIGAVSTLVSAGADFMRSVSGLYTWLPAPVYTVLTSAIILVITIGVIKVFI